MAQCTLNPEACTDAFRRKLDEAHTTNCCLWREAADACDALCEGIECIADAPDRACMEASCDQSSV